MSANKKDQNFKEKNIIQNDLKYFKGINAKDTFGKRNDESRLFQLY